MLKSYLVILFVVCFLFSLQGEAKSKSITPEKKTPVIDREYIKNAKIAAAKKKTESKKAKIPKPLFAKIDKKPEKKHEKKTAQKKSPRKMVRLDFTEPSSKKAPKHTKNSRTVASVKSPTNKKLK